MESTLTIGDLAAATGVPAATLRMWERRYGFPVPRRLPSGHRRYARADEEAVRRVASERTRGIALADAINRVRSPDPESLFATVRRSHPRSEPRLLAKPVLLELTRAVEDETLARAERPVIFGSFQREQFYRASQRRWRKFASSAQLAGVFADFKAAAGPASAPAELPVAVTDPLWMEWAVVCEAAGYCVCLIAREVAPRSRARARCFETVWSVDPSVCRTAVGACFALARAAAPELGETFADLPAKVSERPASQMALASAIGSRALERISGR